MESRKSHHHHHHHSQQPPVTLRDWFVSNHCDDASVQQLISVQSCTCGGREAALTRYFHFISELGSGTFYVLVIPLFTWAGFEHQGVYLCFLLSLGLYITDVLKDTFACPRPPSPPVRRGGKTSHAQEYGWPSTHTALACIMSWECATFFARQHPDHLPLICGTALSFVAQVAFSRMYLGLHWPADIVGGIGVFAFVVLLDAAFLRAAFDGLLSAFDVWPPIFVWLAGHVAAVLHATPRDACPCYEDSVRFIGVDVGAVVGVWMRKRHRLPLPSTTGVHLWDAVLTRRFAGKYVLGIILVGFVDVTGSAAVKRLLPPMMRFLAGGANAGRLQPLYALLCYAVGLLLGKQLHLGGAAGTDYSAKHKEQDAIVTGGNSGVSTSTSGGGAALDAESAPASGVGSRSCAIQSYSNPSGEAASATAQHTHHKTAGGAAAGAFASDGASSGCSNGDSGNGSCAVVVASSASSNGQGGAALLSSSPSSPSSVAPLGVATGRYWSLRNHNHWWEADIQAKMASYAAIGLAVTWGAPCLFEWAGLA